MSFAVAKGFPKLGPTSTSLPESRAVLPCHRRDVKNKARPQILQANTQLSKISLCSRSQGQAGMEGWHGGKAGSPSQASAAPWPVKPISSPCPLFPPGTITTSPSPCPLKGPSWLFTPLAAECSQTEFFPIPACPLWRVAQPQIGVLQNAEPETRV